MKIPALGLVLICLSCAASAMSVLEPPASDSVTAHAEADARQARDNGDLRLLAVVTRGESVPGVAAEHLERIRQHCGLRKIHRSDVIRNTEEKTRLAGQADYIAAYNRLMLTLCLPDD